MSADPSPDVDGFIEAQRRLREKLGATAVFHITQAKTWDPDEPIDPETGRPFDPFAEPTAGGEIVDVRKRVSFVSRPLTSGRALGGDTSAAPIGVTDQSTAAVIVDIADYPDVKDAERVTIAQTMYDLELWRHDTLGPAERWIAYMERA